MGGGTVKSLNLVFLGISENTHYTTMYKIHVFFFIHSIGQAAPETNQYRHKNLSRGKTYSVEFCQTKELNRLWAKLMKGN